MIGQATEVAKDWLVIRGGFNVFPRDVEDVLLEHPDLDVGGSGRPAR
jgi:long-chain acyl-CoA synthetase